MQETLCVLRPRVGVAKVRNGQNCAEGAFAQLLRETERRDEAPVMLAEIYGWFTEGFDTPT
jgi:hypothetical protein